MMKSCFLIVGFAFLIVLIWSSPRRDAEVALGLKWLPLSARRVHVSVDAWTDYVARGSLEVSPKDFERILSLRPYEREDHAEWKVDQFGSRTDMPRVSTTTYRWSDGAATVTLESDSSRSWIHFTYSTK